jgi:release factor glutamine methyltransferase
MKTINQHLAHAIQELSNSDTAGLDATVLLSHATGMNRVEVLTHGEEHLTPKQKEAFNALIERRKNHEPIAYITGSKEFWGLDFAVEPGVLIPRPDTETVIATLLTLIPNSDVMGTVADLGTGSGALIISMLTEFKNMQGFATDTSPLALKISHRNAKTHKVDSRLKILKGNWADPLLEPVNIIVSNPPYISTADMKTLMADVKDHEPESALHGGKDGLDCYKKLIPSAYQKLTNQGILVLETGYEQHKSIYKILEKEKWKDIKSFQDLGKRDRVIIALKP